VEAKSVDYFGAINFINERSNVMYTQKTSRFWINAMVTPFTLALALAALLGTESIEAERWS